MKKEDLDRLVLKQPFTPVRLHLSNGTTYEVTHPDGIMLSEHIAAIAVGNGITFVALLHIAEVEPLPTVRA